MLTPPGQHLVQVLVGVVGGQAGRGYRMGFQKREDMPLLVAAQAPPNLWAAAPSGARPAQGHSQALVALGAQEQYRPSQELGRLICKPPTCALPPLTSNPHTSSIPPTHTYT